MISVVIPFHNDGAYIDDAVDSILRQTYQQVEIVVVDDGSTDAHSVEKLAAYQKPKTKILYKENGHLSSARNFGFRHTKGKYVLVLDADDKFRPTFIEKATYILDTDSAVGAVAANSEVFGVINNIVVPHTGGDSEDFVVKNNAVACALIRRRVWEEVGGYDENMKEGFEDWDFWLGATKRGWKVKVIQEPLFLYRQKNNSMLRESQKIRPELIRYLIRKHPEVFVQHLEKAICEREKIIIKLQENMLNITSSKQYKFINFISRFVRRMKKTVSKNR